MKGTKRLRGDELEKSFDKGKEVLDQFDLENAVRRIVVDLPDWMLKSLDQEAQRIGISRQAVIKTWLAERLDEGMPKARRSLG